MWGKRKVPHDRKEFGLWGEQLAERYLRRQHWKPIARNMTYKSGEIDLVMTDPEGTLVFIEVKTRRHESFQPVETVITETKKRRIRRAAHCFLQQYEPHDCACRYDVVVVIADEGQTPEIRHYTHAFTD